MSTATDIAALKARCLALEKRVAKLEAVKPVDYAPQIAALWKEVDALKYIISPTPPAGQWDSAGPAPNTVFTTRGKLDIYNEQGTTYENLWFQGAASFGGDGGGLIYICNYNAGSEVSNITFRNCRIGTETSTANGVKIVDLGQGGIHDITFDHCHFDYQPRMGIEVIGRAINDGRGGQGYLRVNTTDCTFDASAGEAISYDDDSGTAGYCTVSGNFVDGAGVGDTYQYGAVIENNCVLNMTWANNYFGAGRDSIVNINGNRAALGNLNMVCSGNTYDGTHVPAGVTCTNQLFGIINVAGGVSFADTIINDSGNYEDTWAWFNNNNGVDFGGSTITGTSAADNVYGSGNTNTVWPELV